MSTPIGGNTRYWTVEECAFLREHYGLLSIKEIADHMGRSVDAVVMFKYRRMGGLKSAYDKRPRHPRKRRRRRVEFFPKVEAREYNRESVAEALRDALGQVAASIKWTPDELRRLEEIRG